MSGGSWDYVCFRFNDLAERLSNDRRLALRAMAPHVERLAVAMHAIEWVDSGDHVHPHEEEPIRAFLDGFGSHDVQFAHVMAQDLRTQIEQAQDVLARLEKLAARKDGQEPR